MAKGLNRVYLGGRIGQDPELRMTPSGQSVLNLRMVTTVQYKDNSGTWKDADEWHDVVVWGAQAEAMGKLLRKGEFVLIEGSLRTRSWEDNEGNKRYKTEVVAQNVILTGRSEGGGRTRSANPEAEDNLPF